MSPNSHYHAPMSLILRRANFFRRPRVDIFTTGGHCHVYA